VTLEWWMVAVFWTIALVASLLYGWHAVAIFKAHIAGREEPPPRAWWWHQRWLNFLGALVGWITLWFLLRKFLGCAFNDCNVELNAWDVVGSLVAFVGITGYLPNTVVSLVSGVGALAGKLAEVLAAWVARK
jgi:hypothetical protein